jgi:hypothetical protein
MVYTIGLIILHGMFMVLELVVGNFRAHCMVCMTNNMTLERETLLAFAMLSHKILLFELQLSHIRISGTSVAVFWDAAMTLALYDCNMDESERNQGIRKLTVTL